MIISKRLPKAKKETIVILVIVMVTHMVTTMGTHMVTIMAMPTHMRLTLMPVMVMAD